MERKHIFLIAGSVLVLTAIGIGLYLLTRKPDDGDKNNEEKDKDGSGGGNDEPKTENPPETNPGTNNNTSSIQNGMVVPIFNDEKELKNSLEQLKATQLYPKREWQGGWDYTNVRSSAEVNTDQGWYDLRDNLLTTIGAGTPIGKVISKTVGLYNSYPYTWFKVKLNKRLVFGERQKRDLYEQTQ